MGGGQHLNLQMDMDGWMDKWMNGPLYEDDGLPIYELSLYNRLIAIIRIYILVKMVFLLKKDPDHIIKRIEVIRQAFNVTHAVEEVKFIVIVRICPVLELLIG